MSDNFTSAFTSAKTVGGRTSGLAKDGLAKEVLAKKGMARNGLAGGHAGGLTIMMSHYTRRDPHDRRPSGFGRCSTGVQDLSSDFLRLSSFDVVEGDLAPVAR